MKSYTDIEQSKKLAKILPIESADMWHHGYFNPHRMCKIKYNPPTPYHSVAPQWDCPCWSLAALFDVLRTFTTPTAFSVKVSTPSLIKTENGYKLTYTGDYTPTINNELDTEAPIESVAGNAIDCCVEMILKLYEHKMLELYDKN